ncbi:hypothetical protein [Streptomyces sp. SID2999]|uniref:hypothetical protein n=1 Tax=Streptomyces sp. SID2999 TaxID=2690258 RepID=UPI001926C12D|nr:hypothetical protein [Streptomyces sp. SID2999]
MTAWRPPARRRSGGALRTPSTSLTALCVAVEGAADAGADAQVIDLRRLDLPFHTPEREVPPSARRPLRPAFDVHGCPG